jgi:hypothetical protein
MIIRFADRLAPVPSSDLPDDGDWRDRNCVLRNGWRCRGWLFFQNPEPKQNVLPGHVQCSREPIRVAVVEFDFARNDFVDHGALDANGRADGLVAYTQFLFAGLKPI